MTKRGGGGGCRDGKDHGSEGLGELVGQQTGGQSNNWVDYTGRKAARIQRSRKAAWKMSHGWGQVKGHSRGPGLPRAGKRGNSEEGHGERRPAGGGTNGGPDGVDTSRVGWPCGGRAAQRQRC